MSTAIVTGASRGFGLSLAIALAELGWDLVVDARGEGDLARAVAKVGESGGLVRGIPGDVGDEAHAAVLVEAAVGIGNFTLLVNNASTLGVSPLPSVADYPVPSLDEVLRVNLLGPVRLIQLALPHFRATGGTIVNITSDAAVEAYEGWGGYGASKAALEQVSSVLAVEEPGLRVYWFDPGDMRTRMHQDAFPGEDISDRPLPEARVPGLISLLEDMPPSGRYTAAALLEGSVRR